MKLPRLSVRGLMALVVVSALGLNWFRPIGPREAGEIAEVKFLDIPRAGRWVGRYEVRAGSAGIFDVDRPKRYEDGWTVVVSSSKDGAHLMTMFLTPGGRMRGVDFAPGNFNEIAE